VEDPLKSLGTSDPPRALDTDTAGPTPDAVVRCFQDITHGSFYIYINLEILSLCSAGVTPDAVVCCFIDITHGGFYIYIYLGILSLCTEL